MICEFPDTNIKLYLSTHSYELSAKYILSIKRRHIFKMMALIEVSLV